MDNLLPNLELNSQDLLLGNHFLRQNPEFPDLIFSGSDHEQNEQKILMAETKTKPENSESVSKTTNGVEQKKIMEVNGSCDLASKSNSLVPPAADLQPIKEEQPSTSKASRLLLQHLKGNGDIQNHHNVENNADNTSDERKDSVVQKNDDEKKDSIEPKNGKEKMDSVEQKNGEEKMDPVVQKNDEGKMDSEDQKNGDEKMDSEEQKNDDEKKDSCETEMETLENGISET